MPASAHERGDDRPQRSRKARASSVGAELRGVSLPGAFLGASYLCGDLRLRESIALVGCGTGSGFLTHPDAQRAARTSELAHFRIDWAAVRRRRSRVFFGMGVAEAELTTDRLGFVFSPAADRGDVEAAGAELAGGFDLVARKWSSTLFVRTTVGMAWIPGWTSLTGRSASVPFALLTMNARF
ncbi:MAG: hypothetical protein K0V04_15595 [Deltaproteobacteria bacterium]|nr:hypothetical protein [Deltaproteobacteria bacterium]